MLVVDKINSTDHGNGGVVHLETYRSVNIPLVSAAIVAVALVAGFAGTAVTAMVLLVVAMVFIGLGEGVIRWDTTHAVVDKADAGCVVSQFNDGDRKAAIHEIRDHRVSTA